MIRGFRRAAEIAGVSVATLKRWQRDGLYPPGLVIKVTARTVFFNEQILRAWLSGQLEPGNKSRPVGRPRRVRHA